MVLTYLFSSTSHFPLLVACAVKVTTYDSWLDFGVVFSRAATGTVLPTSTSATCAFAVSSTSSTTTAGAVKRINPHL